MKKFAFAVIALLSLAAAPALACNLTSAVVVQPVTSFALVTPFVSTVQVQAVAVAPVVVRPVVAVQRVQVQKVQVQRQVVRQRTVIRGR